MCFHVQLRQIYILMIPEMQLILLLFSCLLILFTSLTVNSSLFLQYLEIRLLVLGQFVTVLNLFLRGESLWRLSPNIFGVFAICLMNFFQTTTEPNAEPNAEPNTFFIIPLGYLIIALLLVDEEKFVRGLLSDSSTNVEQDFDFKFLPHFRPDLFTLVDPYTGESFNTYSLVGLHGQYLYRSHDSDSEDDDVVDSDLDSLSTIDEVEEDLHEQFEEFLAPHIEALVWEIFPPNLPLLALPG